MMEQLLDNVVRAYNSMFPSRVLILVLLGGVLAVILWGNRREKLVLLGMPMAIIVITILNPVYCMVATKITYYVYDRAYWAIPYTMLFALACGVMYKRIGKRWKRLGLLAVVCAVIALYGRTGEVVNGWNNYQHYWNIEKIPTAAIDVADVIYADAGEDNLVLAPEGVNMFIRQHEAGIKLVTNAWLEFSYGNVDVDGWLEGEYAFDVNGEKLKEIVDTTGLNYVVVRQGDATGYLAEAFSLLDTVDGYNIYKIKE